MVLWSGILTHLHDRGGSLIALRSIVAFGVAVSIPALAACQPADRDPASADRARCCRSKDCRSPRGVRGAGLCLHRTDGDSIGVDHDAHGERGAGAPLHLPHLAARGEDDRRLRFGRGHGVRRRVGRVAERGAGQGGRRSAARRKAAGMVCLRLSNGRTGTGSRREDGAGDHASHPGELRHGVLREDRRRRVSHRAGHGAAAHGHGRGIGRRAPRC